MTAHSPILKLRETLTKVINPATGRNIIAEGRITGLRMEEDGTAHFMLDALNDSQDQAISLLKAAIEKIEAMEGVKEVKALATRHASTATKTAGGHDNPLGIKKEGFSTNEPGQKSSNKTGTPRDLKEFARQSGPTKQDRIHETRNALKDIGHVIAVASGKGGVGKSTIAVNLALGFAAQGMRVGILDVDIYGPSLPTLLGLSGKAKMADGKILPFDAFDLKAMSIGCLVDQTKALAWRGPMVMGAVRQLINDVDWGELDILVLDTPPGTGDVHLSLIQSGAINSAVIVTTPQNLAMADVRRGAALFEQTNVPIIGLIENMAWLTLPDGTRHHVFSNRSEKGPSGGAKAAQDLNITLLGSLPLDPTISSLSDAGTPFMADANSDSVSTESHKTMQEISKQILHDIAQLKTKQQ